MPGQRDEHGLTPQQRAFADAYLADPKRNAQRAYESVYATRGNAARVNASKLLSGANVASYVAKREAELRALAEDRYQITQASVLAELASIGLCDAGDLVDDDSRLLPLRQMPERVRRAVQSIEVTREGSVKVRLWSKTDALDKLAKHLNLYEQHQRNASDALAELLTQIGVARTAESNPIERARRNREKAASGGALEGDGDE